MAKDYYNILGINKSATKDEIKRAFRKKAHEYHPDKGGDEAKFKEVNEAYQILSDETKKQQYDRFGTTFDQAGASGFSGFSEQGMNFEDIGDLFGNMFGGGFSGFSSSMRREKRGGDILVDTVLSFKESIFGAEKEISISKNNTCAHCGGVGAEPGTNLITCTTCSGQGFTVKAQRTFLGAVQTRLECPECRGQGEIPKVLCKECRGYGVIHAKKTLQVEIPTGVENGMRIRIRGQGESVGAAGEPGDLYLNVHVQSDSRFEREGNNLFTRKIIGFTQAALGAEVEVETVDGKVALKIPPGIQSGEQLRLKNKGVPEGGWRGDMYVIIQVKTPKNSPVNKKECLGFEAGRIGTVN